MLGVPPNNQICDDPRKTMSSLQTLDILNYIPRKWIADLSNRLEDYHVYGPRGRVCDREDIAYLDDSSGVPIVRPITFESIRSLHPEIPLYNSNDDLILEPINGSRHNYYIRNPRVLAYETIYRFICKHISSFNYVNLQGIEKPLLEYWEDVSICPLNAENYVEEVCSGLIAAIDDIMTQNPELVISTKLIHTNIHIIKHCDYRTWLYLEMMEENVDEGN